MNQRIFDDSTKMFLRYHSTQLPEKYKENFDVSSSSGGLQPTTNFSTKGLRSKRRRYPCIFQVVASLSIRRFVILDTTETDTDRLSESWTDLKLSIFIYCDCYPVKLLSLNDFSVLV